MKFEIRRFDEVPSTNTLAKEFASKGAREGLVLVADYQTAGRGRPGRKWISPRGKNLLFSVLLRPPVAPRRAPLLTQIACRSVAAVLKRDYEIDSTFKRPNDILVGGKKICGVLVEASTRSNGRLDYVVVGIGLNVNASAEELIPEAASMKEIKGRDSDRGEILEKILAELEKDLEKFYADPS